MERTGGEPDVIGHDKKTGEYIFYDCSAESPKGRRSVCYAGSRPVANLLSLAKMLSGANAFRISGYKLKPEDRMQNSVTCPAAGEITIRQPHV
jgi:hypothetical protein